MAKDVKFEPEKNRWNIQKRLEFIELRLYWEGTINRGDIVNYFGVSVPQASGDLSRYQEIAPQNILYDKSAKTYVAGPKFSPKVTRPSADAYLARLRLFSSSLLIDEQAHFFTPPNFSITPTLRRRLEPEVLRTVLKIIRKRCALEIRYQSLSRPQPIWRWISPHALGFDGLRWHVRAWCHEHEDFRDFVMARVLEVRESRSSDMDPRRDRGWNEEVTLRIGPHPGLKAGAREAIELDYGMKNGVVEITTRVCLSFYVERLLGLDLDPSKVAPERQQIVLLNRDEVSGRRQI